MSKQRYGVDTVMPVTVSDGRRAGREKTRHTMAVILFPDGPVTATQAPQFPASSQLEEAVP
jgi:hypothetical protein